VPARRRRPPEPTPERVVQILDVLERAHPEARCALDYRTPFQLAVATILSAQCTDERVNMVTPELFARYPDAPSLAAAPLPEVEEIIRSTGFFRAKAKSVTGFARGLVERHGGDVPRTMAQMVVLPGVGRKTANVVLGHAYGVAEGIAVDTHVLRVSGRLGIAEGDDPQAVESRLMTLVPRERWTRTTDLLIFHGRKVCDARRPLCGRCPLFTLCAWESRQAWAAAGPRPERPARPPRVPRPSAPSLGQPRRSKAAARVVRRAPARPGRPARGGRRRGR
jgi:endonuclease-3